MKEIMVGGGSGSDHSLLLNEWKKYFRKIHRLKVDFSGVDIPQADDNDFPWFVCVPKNFSIERAFSGGKELYRRWKNAKKSLDDVLDLSFSRDSWTNSYIVRFRANQEADEALKSISANTIAEKGINTGTLKERILLGDFLYWKYEMYLDFDKRTLCSGSRRSDGYVPYANWSFCSFAFHVYFYHPDGTHPDLRAREVVSC